MKKKGEMNKLAILGVLAIVVILGYFFLFRTGGGCETDLDCASGQVCNLDGVCQADTTDEWTYYYGLKPDMRCEDNFGSRATVDPDCPLFCPVGTPLASRAGVAGFCCVNDAENQVIDCDTLQPLFSTRTNDYDENINILPSYPAITTQALLNFRPTGDTGSSQYRENVQNIVTWNAPATYPPGIVSMEVYLKQVSITGSGIKTAFTDAWKTASNSNGNLVWSGATVSPSGIVSGVTNKFTSVTSNGAGTWATASFNLDDISVGSYVVAYTYCFKDEQGRMASEECSIMGYTMDVTSSTISFTVNAQMQ